MTTKTELEKWADVEEDWRELHNVLYWLRERGLFITRQGGKFGDKYLPLIERDIEAEFYKDNHIDPVKLDNERRDLLLKAAKS